MKNRNITCDYRGVDVYFGLPFWFANRGVTTYDNGPRNNTAENALLRLRDVKETCLDHQCWVKVEFRCAPALLPRRIRNWQKKLDRFLARWAKTKETPR